MELDLIYYGSDFFYFPKMIILSGYQNEKNRERSCQEISKYFYPHFSSFLFPTDLVSNTIRKAVKTQN